MKKILLVITLLLNFSVSVRAEGFMSAFEEIPLQDGFEEEDVLSFDTEEFRIIEQYITSTVVEKDEFVKFYEDTLKSLGWELKKEHDNVYTFKREDEGLTINI